MNNQWLVALMLPIAACADGQQTTSSVTNETSPDETIIITANQFPQAKASVLAPVVVLNQSQIQQLQARTLVDVLRTLPGLQLKQLGGMGHQATLFVQGANSDQVLLLIDGMRFTAASMGGGDVSQLPLNSVSRIEYIRGARASIYGSDAMGGVINLITRPVPGDDSTVLEGMVGSHHYAGTSLMSTFTARKKGQFKVALDANGDRGYNIHPTSSNQSKSYGFEAYNGLLGYQHQFNEQWDNYSTLRYQRSYTQTYDSTSVTERGASDVTNSGFSSALRYHGTDFGSELRASYGRYGLITYPDTQSQDEANNRTYIKQYQLGWRNTFWLAQDWTLGLGFDWRRDQLDDSSTVDNFMTHQPEHYAGVPNHRDNTGLYGLAQYQQGIWSAEMSARFDHNEQYNNQPTWSVGGGWAFAPGYQLKLTYGSSFKAPGFDKLYFPPSCSTYQGITNCYLSNPALQPEEAQGWQLTLSGASQWLSWQLNAYDIRYHNLIATKETSLNSHMPININKALIQGITGSMELQTGWVAHSFHLSYQRPRNGATGVDLPLRSRWMGGWQGDLQWQQARFGLLYDYAGSRFAYDSKTRLGGYSLWTATASYQIDAHWMLKMRIDNLFDKQYVTDLLYSGDRGYLGMGRSLYVGFSLRL